MSDIIRAILISSGVIAVSILLAIAAMHIFRALVRKIDRRTKSDLDGLLIRTMDSPIAMVIIVFGLYAAAVILLRMGNWGLEPDTLAAYTARINQVFRAVFTLVAAFAVLRLLNALARSYALAADTRGTVHQVELFKKVLNIAAWALIGVLFLRQLGYEVSALLATLGVAGLAVALALQDTLSNMFAGFYVMADKSIKVGDYVKLESGEEGFVEEVGWRNTRIRLWANNMVIVPNSKLVQSTLTNYDMPQQQLSVYISCGVSYSSDLDHVERVAVETGRQVLQMVPGAVADHEPVVRFKEFGDSNITFVVVLRAMEVGAQYLLHHEFVKALHRRFREEGIEINYPVRVIVPAGDGKERLSV